MAHFLPPPAVLRLTAASILNVSVDLSVSPEKKDSKVKDIFAKDESGFWDRRALGWEM